MDHNELDKLLGERGWIYDNGWQHNSQSWDCYVNDKYRSRNFLVLLAKNGKGKPLWLQRGKPIEKREIWEGSLSSEEDVAELHDFIVGFRA